MSNDVSQYIFRHNFKECNLIYFISLKIVYQITIFKNNLY